MHVIFLLAPLFSTGFSSVPAANCAKSEDPLTLPEHGLKLKLPEGATLKPQRLTAANCKGDWRGNWNGSEIELTFNILPGSTYDLFEPEDVVEIWRDSVRSSDAKNNEAQRTDFVFEDIRCTPKPVGAAPILATVRASAQGKSDPSLKGLLVFAGGILPSDGWSLRIEIWPAPDADFSKTLQTYVETCVEYTGKPRDPRWTDEEAAAFWKRHAPDSALKKFEKPVRTEHYIVLTNSTSPGVFVKKLEAWYAAIRKILPYEEMKGRKLLPVLLFRTDDDFQAYYRTAFKMEAKDDVDESGVVVGSYYATSCDDDDDYDHVIDLTKQLLVDRQRGWGGGQWFRCGLREYAATKSSERKDGLRAVKKGKHTPLAKLLDDAAWGNESRKRSKTGTSEEADYWEQSAMWIEFLREGPWPKDKFPTFVRTVGSLREDDHAGVVAAIQSVYATDPLDLEKQWVAYFSKR